METLIPMAVQDFLKEMAFKHNCDINKIMVGFAYGYFSVWKYDEGSAKPFTQLEMFEPNPHRDNA